MMLFYIGKLCLFVVVMIMLVLMSFIFVVSVVGLIYVLV